VAQFVKKDAGEHECNKREAAQGASPTALLGVAHGDPSQKDEKREMQTDLDSG
jgi:hypothetical protein